MSDLDAFPKCTNCGRPILPDDIGHVWLVTVQKKPLDEIELASDGRSCALCGGPVWNPGPVEDD